MRLLHDGRRCVRSRTRRSRPIGRLLSRVLSLRLKHANNTFRWDGFRPSTTQGMDRWLSATLNSESSLWTCAEHRGRSTRSEWPRLMDTRWTRPRRWREGASTQRDAEIARSLCTPTRRRRSRQMPRAPSSAARSSYLRPASSRRPCPPDRRRPPAASRSPADASRGPRSSPALRPRWTYRGPCSILQRISTRCSQWSPSRPRTRGPASYTCRHRRDDARDGRRINTVKNVFEGPFFELDVALTMGVMKHRRKPGIASKRGPEVVEAVDQ